MGNIQDELSVEDLKKTITSLVEGAVEGIINRRISNKRPPGFSAIFRNIKPLIRCKI